MRLFDGRAGLKENFSAIKAAEAYAAEGGQALHVWSPDQYGEDAFPKAPAVFKRSKPWAHLFDNDKGRLVATAKALGVRIVKIDREGRKGQHIDLCAGPLRAAMAMCNPDEDPTPVRHSTTRVVNLHKEEFEVYIGRAGIDQDGYFGNPFPISQAGSRKLSIEYFKAYFIDRVQADSEFRRRVIEIRGKTLGCFCKPDACHGDVIAEWLDTQPEVIL